MSSIKKSSSIYSKNNDISVSELKKLYMSELAELFGVKPNTVFYRLKKLNKEGIYA